MAKFQYEAVATGELSFEAGDVIHVTEKRASGWWLGRLAGRAGWFPASFVYSGNVVVVVQGGNSQAGPATPTSAAAAASSDDAVSDEEELPMSPIKSPMTAFKDRFTRTSVTAEADVAVATAPTAPPALTEYVASIAQAAAAAATVTASAPDVAAAAEADVAADHDHGHHRPPVKEDSSPVATDDDVFANGSPLQSPARLSQGQLFETAIAQGESNRMMQRKLDDSQSQLEFVRSVLTQIQKRELGLNQELADAKATIALRDVDVSEFKAELERTDRTVAVEQQRINSAEQATRQASDLEVTKLKVKIETADALEHRLRQENAALESALAALKARFTDSAKAQQAALDGVSEARAGITDRLETDLAEARSSTNSLRLELAELKATAEGTKRLMQAEIDTRGSAEKRVAELQASLAEVTASRDTNETEWLNGKRDLAQASARLEQATANCIRQDVQLAEWESRYNTLQQAASVERAAADLVRAKARGLEDELSETSALTTRRVSTSEREVERLEAQCKALVDRERTLSDGLQIEMRDKVLLEESSRDAAANVEAMSTKLERESRARRASEDRENALRSSVAAQREEMEIIVRTAKEANRELETLRETQRKVDKLTAENRHLHAIMNLKDDLEYRERVLELEAEVATLKQADSEATSIPNDPLVQKLFGQISALEEENLGLRQTVEKLVQDLMVAKDAS